MKKKTVYMLTVVYSGGRVKDIEFDTKEDRKLFVEMINYGMCKCTFWEKEVIK